MSIYNQRSLDKGSYSPERPSKIARVKEQDLTNNDDNEDEHGEEQREPTIGDRAMIQNPRIQRYLVTIEYIGTRFSGAQNNSMTELLSVFSR
ncbi:unnamed protein product [Ilex paraguariensis]|uniref:Uncharacterized protein n=1 Tax=Ilex paraguariensis TaxID=185542 RepID=A0ABC8T1Q7_9AQUA